MTQTPKKGKSMSKSKNSAARVLEDLSQSKAPTESTVKAEPTGPKLDDKGRISEVKMSMEDIETRGWKNKSQIIRGLAGENYSRSAIAKFLNIRYQHVRNVLMQPLKKQA